MPYLFVLCGLPYTGKTTMRNKLIAGLNNVEETAVVISSDDKIDEKLASLGVANLVGQEFSDMYRPIRQEMLDLYARSLHQRRNIIVDRTNLPVQARAEWIKTAKSYLEYQIICLLTEAITDTEFERRRKERAFRYVPEDDLARMRKSYVPPSLEEGFHEIMDYTAFNVFIEALNS